MKAARRRDKLSRPWPFERLPFRDLMHHYLWSNLFTAQFLFIFEIHCMETHHEADSIGGPVELLLRKWPREVCLQGAALSGRHGDAVHGVQAVCRIQDDVLRGISCQDQIRRPVCRPGWNGRRSPVRAVTGWSAEA